MNRPVYHAAIEHGTTDKWYGRIIELPGCIGKANSKSMLIDSLNLEISNYYDWLHKHGENNTFEGKFNLQVVEEREFIPKLGESGGCVALFDFDNVQISGEMLSRYLVLYQFSRHDLLSLVENLEMIALEKQLKDSTRTTLQVLSHIANAEEWYISRLGEDAELDYQSYTGLEIQVLDNLPILERLSIVRKASLSTLQKYVIVKGKTKFIREKYTDFSQEEWTAHKVLRRFLEHEREHFASIKERLSI